MKKLFARIGSAVLVLLLLAGCSGQKSLEEQMAGSWYAEGREEPMFTLYSDGTCEIAGEYGSGTWAVVNDKTLKLSNYYGETQTAVIVSVSDGCLTLEQGTGTGKTVSLWDSADKALDQSLKQALEDYKDSNS